MKNTKTVTIKGHQFGFTVRNNNETVANVANIRTAYEIAKTYGKPIRTVNI